MMKTISITHYRRKSMRTCSTLLKGLGQQIFRMTDEMRPLLRTGTCLKSGRMPWRLSSLNYRCRTIRLQRLLLPSRESLPMAMASTPPSHKRFSAQKLLVSSMEQLLKYYAKKFLILIVRCVSSRVPNFTSYILQIEDKLEEMQHQFPDYPWNISQPTMASSV